MMCRPRVWLSKLNFELGYNPRVSRHSDRNPSGYVPVPYNAVLIISADLEMAWAWRYAKGAQKPRNEAVRLASITRRNIPKILQLCDAYNVPITWATVGHLFLDGCSKNGHLAHSDLHRIPYHQNAYWKYDRGDWFDDDPCTDWQTSPEWYAPDLIRMILDSRVEHEVACHTFSHIDCSDSVCSPKVLLDEVHNCQKSARGYGIELKTFVHPGHTIGNLKTLYTLGFRSFRTDYVNTLDYPQRHKSGLWELKSTMEFVHKHEWSVDYHVHRYKEIINRALAAGRLCLFWFHPSLDAAFVDEIMPRIFSYINTKRKIIWITTIKDYVTWLDRKGNA